MILSFFTQKSTRSAKLSSVFAERFLGEGQADFAINKAHNVSLKGRNNLYISCVFNGFKYICIYLSVSRLLQIFSTCMDFIVLIVLTTVTFSTL